MFRLFRRQPFVWITLEQPVQPVPQMDHAQIVLLRSAAQGAANCAEIAAARYRREQREARLTELLETQRMEQQCAWQFQERRF